MNRHDVDLNLLQTFHAVHAAASVSRAAQRLGVSQPTVSHALARLRTLYRDPLFVRAQGGMAPTAKAERLAHAVEQALATLDVAIREAEQFDPGVSKRTFRLHMSDIGETIFLPPLIRTLARVAPGMRLEAFQLDDKDILPALDAGRVDLALGYIPALTDVRRRFLLHEEYVVLMRAGHPLARRRPTRAALRHLDFVLVRSHPATGRALTSLGVDDRVRLTIPHFMVLPRILADSDLAVVMPSRLARAFRRLGRYATWKLRTGLPKFDVSVHWSWRFETEPGNRWLRDTIVELFAEDRA